MKPTINLIREHAQIKLMLAILKKISGKLADGQIPQKTVEDIGEFLRVYADALHHGKEEKYLFPALEQVGSEEDKKLIDELLKEHNQSRQYVKSLSQNAKKYVALLTEHIKKEDFRLFPIANKKLSDEKQTEMEKDFAKIDTDIITSELRKKFAELLVKLRQVYL